MKKIFFYFVLSWIYCNFAPANYKMKQNRYGSIVIIIGIDYE